MFNFKESFNITNKYIILATPLILFSLLSSLYILFSINGNLISIVIAIVLFTLMLAAFLSGWFYMIKCCVQNSDNDDPNSLIKEFPAGVGEYFLQTLGLIFNTFVFSSVMLIISYFVGMKLIGDIGVSADAVSKAMESMTALKAFMISLSQEQLMRLNAWNLLLFGAVSIVYFLIMFYSPALFFKEKNPFKAFWFALKDLFSGKFFKNFALYLILFAAYFVLSILTTMFGANIFMHFIFTLVNFYYLVLAAVSVYNFYYNNYVKIGGNLDKTV